MRAQRVEGIGGEAAPARAGTGRKAEQMRRRIREAAADVIGRDGYPGTSIAKITEAAGISGGLFYYYYGSREQLFDELLPELGREMVAYIVARIDHLPLGIEREMAGFEAYFRYIEDYPSFVRIFTEAVVYVPVAYEAHLGWIIDNYVLGLRRQLKAGCLDIAEGDLRTLAYTLTGIRNHATQMIYRSPGSSSRTKESLTRVYRQMIGSIFVLRRRDDGTI